MLAYGNINYNTCTISHEFRSSFRVVAIVVVVVVPIIIIADSYSTTILTARPYVYNMNRQTQVVKTHVKELTPPPSL